MTELAKALEAIMRPGFGEAPDARDAEIVRLTNNFKDVVKIKRRTDARLKAALAGLQQIYDVCGGNDADTCNHRLALKFVREVACDAFEKATAVTNGGR